MHRETLSVPQNRAAHLVFGDDACGPIRRSLVTWSTYSFRSSHLLLLLFLKPANDLVTVFLSVSLLTPLFFEFFFFSAQHAFKRPKKENLIGYLIQSLKYMKCFFTGCSLWHVFLRQGPPPPFWLMPMHLSSLRESHFLYKSYLRLWNWVKYFFVFLKHLPVHYLAFHCLFVHLFTSTPGL